MKYPTLEAVEAADRRQICYWWRFLPCPGSWAIGKNWDRHDQLCFTACASCVGAWVGKNEEPMKLYVITYEYFDKSGFGTVGAWTSEEAAREAISLLEKHGDISKKFKLTEFPSDAKDSKLSTDKAVI